MSEQKNKFEAMLEKLVADDKSGAEELFHDIVVEKSREIYENLLDGDLEDAKVEEKTAEADAKEDKKDEKSVEEKADTSEKEEDAVEEKTDASEKEEDAVEEKADDSEKAEDKVDEVTTDEVGIIPAEQEISQQAPEGDATDDMIGDIEADKGEENGDDADHDGEDMEDRVVDLEDAIDDLKAEFEKMMSDKEEGDDDSDDSEEEKEDEAVVDQSAEGEVEIAPVLGDQPAVESTEAPKSATEEIREYVNKVSASNTDGSDNSKSPVAGKNDMGGSSSNLVQGGEEAGSKAPAAKEEDAGNVNKPGAKAKMTAAPKAQTKADDDGSATKSTLGS